GDARRARRCRQGDGRCLALPRHRQGGEHPQPPAHRRRDPAAVRARRGVRGHPDAPGLPGPALLPPLRWRPRRPRAVPGCGVVRTGRAVRRRVGPDELRRHLRHAAARALRAAGARRLRARLALLVLLLSSGPRLTGGRRGRDGQPPALTWAASKTSWRRAWSSAVTSRTARRDPRPAGGGAIGSPTTRATRTGRSPLAPFGMARSDPPMPTGTIGTPVRRATYAAPSNRSWTIGPLWRVPSGNRTSGSPDSMTSMQRRRASRSTVPRCTGNPPSADRNRALARLDHNVSLPMNRRR